MGDMTLEKIKKAKALMEKMDEGSDYVAQGIQGMIATGEQIRDMGVEWEDGLFEFDGKGGYKRID